MKERKRKGRGREGGGERGRGREREREKKILSFTTLCTVLYQVELLWPSEFHG